MRHPLGKRLRYLKSAVYCSSAMVQQRLFKKRFPLGVVLYLTYRCNLRCPFCNFWSMTEEEMTTLQVFSLIDKLKQAGTQRLGLVGGEPTLRKDIEEIIGYSRKKGLFTTLCSNGKIEESKVRQLKYLDILLLSLDGPKQVHDSLRGEGSYDGVIKTIEAAKDLGIEIWLSALLMNGSLEYIDHIVGLSQKYDLKCSFQPVVRYSGSPEKIENFSLGKEGLQAILKKLIDYKKTTDSIALSESYLRFLYEFWPRINAANLPCFAGRMFCVITPSGYVFPCQPEKGQKGVSNVLTGDFKEIFSGLKKYECNQCFCDSFMETNLLFSADQAAMWNIAKNMILK